MSLTTCPKCSAPVSADDRFCQSCGEKLISEAAPPPPPSAPPSPPLASPLPHEAAPLTRTQPSAPTKPLLLIAGAVLVGALIIIWIHPGKSGNAAKKTGATAQSGQLTGARTASSTDTSAVTTSIAPLNTPAIIESGNTPPALARGVELFIHNFQTPRSIFTPLFGPTVMRISNAGSEGRLDGLSAGILPAMLGKFMLNDFVVECDMRPQSVPPGARYGLIFRSADVQGGGISAYYIVTLAPNENVVAMNCWNNSAWVMNAEQPLPRGSLQTGQTQRLSVAAIGTEFSIYINEQFVAKFSDATLTEGRLGLCVAGTSGGTCTVYFDNFAIYMPP